MTFCVFFFSLCSSEEWNKVSKSEREKLGVTVQDDGEFWWETQKHSDGLNFYLKPIDPN